MSGALNGSRVLRRQDGSAMLLAIFAIVLLTAAGLALIQLAEMNIQLSKKDSTLEEVGLMLARNFLVAHSANELAIAGKALLRKKREEALGDAG